VLSKGDCLFFMSLVGGNPCRTTGKVSYLNTIVKFTPEKKQETITSLMTEGQWNQILSSELYSNVTHEQKTVCLTRYSQNSIHFCTIKAHLPFMYTVPQKPLKFNLFSVLK
jgi:hypothetical protein